MKRFTTLLGLLGMVGTVAACSGSADGTDTGEANATSALALHAEASPLKDFSYDTGLLPEGSPAQVQLKLSAGGGIKVDTAVEPGSDGLSGKPGGGKLALDIHVKLDGRLKVASTFKDYDGDIPGLKDINIPILGSVPFDGFLLGDGESAEAKAELPETTLPEIPLGSIPGSLVITVAKGSILTTKFHGSCLSVAGGQAKYSGESKTGGTLILKAKIVLKLPIPLNKSVDLPAITVAIPEITTGVEGAALAVSGVADSSKGSCGAPPKATSSAAPPPKAPSTPPGTGPGTDGGADGGKCDWYDSQKPTCDACLAAKCCTEGAACTDSYSCGGVLICVAACTDDLCALGCRNQYGVGDPAVRTFGTCIQTSCATECMYTQ